MEYLINNLNSNCFLLPTLSDSLKKAREKAKRKEENPYSNLESSEPNTPSSTKRQRKRKQISRYTVKPKKLNLADFGTSSSEIEFDSSDQELPEPQAPLHGLELISITNQPQSDDSKDLTEGKSVEQQFHIVLNTDGTTEQGYGNFKDMLHYFRY